MGAKNIEAALPLPLQVVLDDTGWWRGEDGHEKNEPYRSGFSRRHKPADYLALAELGRLTQMRPQAAMLLGEWDRENILRKVPSATWQGSSWDNSVNVGPWLDEAAEIINNSNKYFEFTLHGLLHEFWSEGKMDRAEWQSRASGKARESAVIRQHLDAFFEIMHMNGIKAKPESFVPCAFQHTFAGGENGVEAILAEYGIKFISTPFSSMNTWNFSPQKELLGASNGILTSDRGENGVPWNKSAATPPAATSCAVLGLHWPNILHDDPELSGIVVEEWAEYINSEGKKFERIKSCDTADFFSQLAFHQCASVSCSENSVTATFDGIEEFASILPRQEFYLKVKIPASESPSCTGGSVKLCESHDGILTLRIKPETPAKGMRLDF